MILRMGSVLTIAAASLSRTTITLLILFLKLVKQTRTFSGYEYY
jgi:hypothetical protein